MPLEVRQIGIRLDVGDASPSPAPAAEGSSDRPGISPAERAAIVEDCVEAVLDALRRAGER